MLKWCLWLWWMHNSWQSNTKVQLEQLLINTTEDTGTVKTLQFPQKLTWTVDGARYCLMLQFLIFVWRTSTSFVSLACFIKVSFSQLVKWHLEFHCCRCCCCIISGQSHLNWLRINCSPAITWPPRLISAYWTISFHASWLLFASMDRMADLVSVLVQPFMSM